MRVRTIHTNPKPQGKKLLQLSRHIQICKQALTAARIERISIAITGTTSERNFLPGARFTDLLLWDPSIEIEIPLEELLNFLQSYADRCKSETLNAQILS